MFDTVMDPVTKTAFNPLVEAGNSTTGYGETIISGLTAQYNSRRAYKQPFLGGARGTAGQPISTFVKNGPGSDYAKLLDDVLQGFTLAGSSGLSYRFGGVVYMQGETDEQNLTPYATYLATLEKLIQDLDMDIRNITGQIRPVMTLISQVSSHQFYNATPTVCTAQYASAKAMPTLAARIGPKYQYPGYVSNVHLNNHGQRAHGVKVAQVVEQIYSKGLPWQPLWPTLVKRFSTKSFVARFNVPSGPLVFDTTLVTDPNGQKGFEYYDDAGSAALTTVELIGDTDIHFSIGRAMNTNPKLRYAYTGTVGQVGGPTTGARGCLRDSDATVSYYSDASSVPYKLYNWCVHFEEPIL